MPFAASILVVHLLLASVALVNAAAPVATSSPSAITAPRATNSASPMSTNRHTLWKVKGAQNTVYLLGSVHLLKSSDYPLAPEIETAFSNASIVAFETDIAALDDPAIALKLMSKGRLPEGSTLATEVSPATYQMLKAELAKSGLPAEMFDQFTPAMAALTLSMLGVQQLGLEPENGIDKHFFRLACAAGKQIIPLETVDFQIAMATDFSKEEGELLLKITLKEVDGLKKEIGDLVKAWKSGDAESLEKLLNAASKEAPAIHKRLLIDRNRNWIPKIEELARAKNNAVVIVGAAHLVGKDGVVDLLRKRNFSVVQE
jgi:uncharacterized protein